MQPNDLPNVVPVSGPPSDPPSYVPSDISSSQTRNNSTDFQDLADFIKNIDESMFYLFDEDT